MGVPERAHEALPVRLRDREGDLGLVRHRLRALHLADDPSRLEPERDGLTRAARTPARGSRRRGCTGRAHAGRSSHPDRPCGAPSVAAATRPCSTGRGGGDSSHRFHRRSSAGVTRCSPWRRPRRAARTRRARGRRGPVTRVSVDAITEPASARFASITAAMRSSIVPGHTSVWTSTPRVWPMRHTRSDAWSSTAGFHQRSKWITWFARTRLRPGATGTQRHREDAGAAARGERLDDLVALGARHAAVQHRHRRARAPPARCGCDAPEEPGVLAEHDDGLVLGDDLLGQLDEPVELAGAAGELARVVGHEARRVVADLLELRDAREDVQPAALRVGDARRPRRASRGAVAW